MSKEAVGSSLDVRYENVVSMIHDMATNPVIDDPILQEIYAGVDAAISHRDDLRTMIRARLLRFPDATTTDTGYIISRCIQYEVLKEDPIYPDRGVPDDWTQKINEMLDDPVTHESLFESMTTRTLQTNIADRYKSVHMILQWLEANGRLHSSPLWLDIGCSQNFGMKRVWIMGKVDTEGRFDSFGETDVYVPDERQQGLVHHQKLSEAVKFLLNREVNLYIGQGMDKHDMYDSDVRRWAKSCLRPGEIQAAQKGSFDFFDSINPDGLSFTQLDILSDEATAFMDVSSDDVGHGNFDVVSAMTMAYQLNTEQRLKLFEIMHRYARPDGVVILQDFAQVDPESADSLLYEDDWFALPYNYRTFMVDKLNPDAGFQEVMHWSSGRCEGLVPQNARLESNVHEKADFVHFLGSVAAKL